MTAENDTTLEAFQEDFSLFIESGFIAIKELNEAAARQIFSAAQVLRPNSTAPKVGFGYIYLNRLEHERAAEIFLEVLEEEPDNHLARTFLGMSYMLNRDRISDGEKAVQEALGSTDDPTVKQLCNTALEWCDKDMKVKKAPFFENN